MTGLVRACVALLAAAALGSIPFGLLVARIWSGTDVRRAGSGNIGATNVMRVMGPLPGLLTLLLDAAKGAVAVALARIVAGPADAAPPFGPHDVAAWAGFAAVAGHVFSPWLGLRGGKGVATAAGVLAVLSPPLFCTAAAAFLVGIVTTRIVSVGSVLAALSLPVAGALRIVDPLPPVAFLLALCVLVLVRHRDNLARLRRGEESRLGSSRPGGDGAR